VRLDSGVLGEDGNFRRRGGECKTATAEADQADKALAAGEEAAGAEAAAAAAAAAAATAAAGADAAETVTGEKTARAEEADADTGTAAAEREEDAATAAEPSLAAADEDLLPRTLVLKRYCFRKTTPSLFPTAEEAKEEHYRLHRREPCRWCVHCRQALTVQCRTLLADAPRLSVSEQELQAAGFASQMGFVLEQLMEDSGLSQERCWEEVMNSGGTWTPPS